MKNRGNCDARHLTRLPPGVYWGPARAAGRPGRGHAVRFRRFFPLAMAALAAFLLAGSSPASAAAATITVNSSADTDARDGVLTLREAILLATGGLAVSDLTEGECAQVSGSTYTPPCSTADSIGAASPDSIVFGGGLGAIALGATLPTLSTAGDTIDGGSDVVLDGVTTSFSCLLVSGEAADNNMIKGLEVKRCIDGISIYAGADGNTVGGSAPTDRNLIHSNGSHGVLIAGSASTSNIVAGNYIGTNAAGSAAMPNAIGVHVY